MYLLSFLARAFKNLTFKIDFKQGPRGSLALSSMNLSAHWQEFFLLLLFFLLFWTPVTPVTLATPASLHIPNICHFFYTGKIFGE